jgi:hypothetical protein
MGEWLGIGRDAVARAARGEGFRSAELIDAMTAGGLWDREARFVALAYGAQDERHLLNALGAKQYPIVRYFVTKTLAEAFTVVRGVLARKPPFADGGADPLTPERAMPYLRVGRAYLRSKFDKKKIPEDWHEDIIQEALVDMFSGARWWFVEDPLRYFKGVVRSTAHDWLREKQL